MNQAMKVASIPEDDFEELVESESPPTITKLAGNSPKIRARCCPHCGKSLGK